MKSFKKNTLLLSAILVMGASSCKKAREFIENGYNQPNAECLITHTEDDLFGFSVDIFYNEAGNPDSLSYRGSPVTLEYDSDDRLSKAIFGDAIYGADRPYFTYIYTDNTFLPAVLNYYSPLNGGLIAVDSFKYNILGEMVKIGVTNVRNPIFNKAEYYDYDNKGNVKKVMMVAQNGGTVYDTLFTEYEVLTYDNKPNFMSGNQWLKYVFFYSELDTYVFKMFSRNNAADWLWRPEAYKAYFPDAYFLSDTFEYNDKGFTNKIHIRFSSFQGAEDYFDALQLSSSTCDASTGPLQRPAHKNLKAMPKRKDGIPLAITSL